MCIRYLGRLAADASVIVQALRHRAQVGENVRRGQSTSGMFCNLSICTWQIGKFIGSYAYTAKGHQYQAAGVEVS